MLLLVSCYTHNINVVVAVVTAFVVGLYYVRFLLQRTLGPVVTDFSATVVVNATIVVHANVAAVNVAAVFYCCCCYYSCY